MHVVYYLEPRTLLPVAMKLRTTPVLDSDGKVQEDYKQTKVFNYHFPATLPVLTLKDTRPISFTPARGLAVLTAASQVGVSGAR